MQSFNIDSKGEKIRINLGSDISTATALSMELLPHFGTELNATPTLGTVDVYVGDEKFLANQYVEFTTTEAMFDYIGRWKMKAIATLPSEVIASDFIYFRVTD